MKVCERTLMCGVSVLWCLVVSWWCRSAMWLMILQRTHTPDPHGRGTT